MAGNIIRIRYVAEFHFGDDAVLVAADNAGFDSLRTALIAARRHGAARLEHTGRIHEIAVTPGAADIELSRDHVIWRLDDDTADDIITRCDDLLDQGSRPGHHYVDISSPAATLVLSLNEYLEPSWLTEGKEPLFPDDGAH